MNSKRWSWLVLAAAAVAVPGCLLVQPIDDAKSDAAGGTSAAGSSNVGGKANGSAGSRPSGDSGDTGEGGDGEAGEGPSPNGGAGPSPNGGRGGAAPSAGSTSAGGGNTVDFSLFIGDWYPTSGTVSTLCDDSGSSTPTVEDVDINYRDTFDVGTVSDLIWDLEGDCSLLVDVTDLTASVEQNWPGQTCSIVDADSQYPIDISYDSFVFKIATNGKTATSSTKVTEDVSNTDGKHVRTCTQDFEVQHSRTDPTP